MNIDIFELLDRFGLVIVGGVLGSTLLTYSLWGKIFTPEKILTRKKAKIDKQLRKLKRQAEKILRKPKIDWDIVLMRLIVTIATLTVGYVIYLHWTGQL